MTSSPIIDRRAATKDRHRSAIIDAADALITERGSSRFSVDELAERADVARRTVFNHFASLDDVVTAACTRVLSAVIESFQLSALATPVGDGSRASMFDEIAQAIRRTDLPHAVAYMGAALGTLDAAEARANAIVQDAFSRVSDQLAAEVARRNAGADPLDVALLVGSLLQGVVVIARHWADHSGAALDDAARARWDELLERLFTSVRTGYLPEH